MNEIIVEIARNVYQELKEDYRDVSQSTVNAKTVGKEWQRRCIELRGIQMEVNVSNNLGSNQSIDILDFNERIAYEWKISGNNPGHEFYKDLLKCVIYNCYNANNRIEKFVFITENKGIIELNRSIDTELLRIMEEMHLVKVELIGI